MGQGILYVLGIHVYVCDGSKVMDIMLCVYIFIGDNKVSKG